MIIARRGELSLRAMRDDEADYELLASWLSDPRVLEWYEGRDRPFDIAAVREHYSPRVLADDEVQPCIVVDGGEPIGYLQYFPVATCADEYEIDPAIDCSRWWATDLFIGDPARWGSGVGTAALSLAVDHLFVEERAERVIVDPRVANARAIRSYEKIGFRTAKVLAEHEVHEGQAWDCALMELDALDHPVGLTARLAEIDSVNPSLVPGAAGEGAIARFVEHWCLRRGFEVERREIAPDRFNVVAVRRGSGGGRSLLFNGHLDTVGPASPSTAQVRLADGRLEGRGVLDTKGGLAAALLAAAAVRPGELAGDVIVAAVADEEHASIGTEALVATSAADAAVVLEPTGMSIVPRHRGFAVVEATFTGRAAHTSRPDRGANAVHAAARAVQAVVELDRSWEAAAGDPIERPSALAGRLHSTGETFTVPAHCELTVEVRTTASGVAQQTDEVIRAVLAAAGDSDVDVRVVLERPPLGLAGDHPLVTALVTALGPVVHHEPVIVAAPYWTDAALHVERGTPAVVFGPTGEGLHEDLEWVSTASLVQCAAALTRLVQSWCGPAHPAVQSLRS